MSAQRAGRPDTGTEARSARRHYVVHDGQGRILALAPVGPVLLAGGTRAGWRPMPAAGQKVAEIELDAGQMALGLDVVLATYRVDTPRGAKTAVLRRIAPAS